MIPVALIKLTEGGLKTPNPQNTNWAFPILEARFDGYGGRPFDRRNQDLNLSTRATPIHLNNRFFLGYVQSQIDLGYAQ